MKRICGEELLKYVARDLNLVTGGEHGRWWGVRDLHYLEGMMSGGSYSWPAGHLLRPQTKEHNLWNPEKPYDPADMNRSYFEAGAGLGEPVPDGPYAGWYVWGGPEAQLNEDPITYITQDKGEILNQEYGYIVSHCGYADADLFKLTSFSTCRVKDIECMTSEEVKNWVKENNIELASFKDLPKEWI